jgi:hypothetical protein
MADQKSTLLRDPQIQRSMRINPGNAALIADATTRLAGTMFGADLDTAFWTAAHNGTVSAAVLSDGIVTLASGTANNGYGSLISVRHGRFLFVNPNLFRMGARLTSAAVANCTRIIGACDITAGNPPTLNNGFYFAFDAAGALTVNCKVAGSAAVSVASGSFNGEVAAYTIDTNVHAFEILYFVMGVWFFIDGVLIHKFTPTTSVLSNDLDLHCFAEVVNSAGGTTSGALAVWASSILRLGKELTRPMYRNIAANSATPVVCKRGSGSLHAIIINKAGNTSNSLTLYDNTTNSAPVIGTLDTNVTREIQFGPYGLDFQNGLTVVLNNGTAADVTLLFD